MVTIAMESSLGNGGGHSLACRDRATKLRVPVWCHVRTQLVECWPGGLWNLGTQIVLSLLGPPFSRAPSLPVATSKGSDF